MEREKNPLEASLFDKEKLSVKQHKYLAKYYLTMYYSCNLITHIAKNTCTEYLDKFEFHYDKSTTVKK